MRRMSALEMWKAIVVSTVICICSKGVMSGLTVVPKNTVTKVGEVAYLNCSTNLVEKQIHWFHGGNYIYAGGSYFDPYIGRFKVENVSQGAFNLVIGSVEAGDAGTYMCQDDGGHGQKSSAELVVIETGPFCGSNTTLNEVIGANSCGLEPEDVTLTCSISYNGKFQPEIIWKRLGDNVTITEDVNLTTDGKTVSSFLSFKANDLLINEDSFVCETTQSLNLQYNCLAPNIRILYAFSNSTLLKTSMDEEIVCSADSNQNCSYEWKWFKAQEVQTVSRNKFLNPDKTGNYRCEAKCQMKNKLCIIESMVIEVVASASASSRNESFAWWWVMALVIAVVLLIAIIVCIIVKRKQRNTSSLERDPTTESILYDKGDNGIKYKKSNEIVSSKEEQSLISKDEKSNMNKEESRKPIQATDDAVRDYSIEKLATCTVLQGKEIRGLAVGDGRIYILTNDPTYLELHSINDHKNEAVRPLANIVKQPFDIAYCQLNKQLYIMDATKANENKTIITLNQFGVMIKSWNTEMDFGNLSVSSDRNVVLTALRAIKEYSPDGKLIHLIEVHETIFPLCAIKVDTYEFLVSKVGNVHEVCLVKISESSPADTICQVEKVEKSFGKKTGSKSEQLNCPRSLALSENKDVFVLDEKNNRVLILSSDLKFKKEFLLVEHGLHSPVKLCINESTQKLIIAGNSVDSTNLGEKPGILILTLMSRENELLSDD